MYKIFIKNLEGFEKIFKNDERLKLAKPLYLLKDLGTFESSKNNNTKEYQNLCKILRKAMDLKETSKYHSFGMFFTELHLQYFEFDTISFYPQDLNEELDYQVSLLHQFMFPAYY